jgi:hypothetical protein
MSVAEPRTRRVAVPASLGWPLALAGLFVAALILRLIGLRTGLPYVYNADENSHFVPHAIGMFGHGFNPDYFVNPPAYTYVLHALFALRWGTDPSAVGGAFAADPTGAFTIARAASAVLGALAVPLTAIAGARLFDDRRVGLLAGALLAVAFLPVHYSHFALNDAPTLAPLALCLVGVAGIYKTGRLREYLLAGAALGIAIATKYQGGILLVTVIAAALVSPVAHPRVRNLFLAVGLMLCGFLVANPYALLDRHAFWDDGIRKQTEAAGDEGGKLGLANTSGWWYYLTTSTWGLGWLPSLAALGGVVARRPPALALRDPRARPLRAAAAAAARLQRPQRRRPRAGRYAHGRPRLDEAAHPARREDRHGADRPRPVGRRPRPPELRRHRLGQPLEQVADVALVLLQRQGDRPRRLPGGQARGLRAHDARLPAAQLHGRRLLLGDHGLDPVRARAGRPQGRARRDRLLRRAAAPGLGRLPDLALREGRGPVLVRLLVQLLPARLRAPRAGDRDLPVARGQVPVATGT